MADTSGGVPHRAAALRRRVLSFSNTSSDVLRVDLVIVGRETFEAVVTFLGELGREAVLCRCGHPKDWHEHAVSSADYCVSEGECVGCDHFSPLAAVDPLAEVGRLRSERDDAIGAEKIAVLAIGAENERLLEVVKAAQREEDRHLLAVDNLTNKMPPAKQEWYRVSHTASCDLAGVLARNKLASELDMATSVEHELDGWTRVPDSEFFVDGHLNFDHPWYAAPHWGCENGHLSDYVLKSDALGRDACLACRGTLFPVVKDTVDALDSHKPKLDAEH